MRSALKLLLRKGSLDEDDIKLLVLNCKMEVGIQDETHRSANSIVPAQVSLRAATNNGSIRLVAVHELKGINALDPRKPLEFGNARIAVVYGLNASGKSGYIRVLKHASGQRNPGPLHHNVFSEDKGEQSCIFRCEIDGTVTDLQWRKSKGPLVELRGFQVYDTNCGSIYINAENEAAYEPFELTLLTRLTEACGRVSAILDSEILGKASRKPAIPPGLLRTQSAIWYEKLSRLTTPAEIAQRCAWSDELEAELNNLNQRLVEANPSGKAKDVRKSRDKLLLSPAYYR